jgi:hypothetical protein
MLMMILGTGPTFLWVDGVVMVEFNSVPAAAGAAGAAASMAPRSLIVVPKG